LLQVLPLGLAMLCKGKMPNPLASAITGITQIRAIFAMTSRKKGVR